MKPLLTQPIVMFTRELLILPILSILCEHPKILGSRIAEVIYLGFLNLTHGSLDVISDNLKPICRHSRQTPKAEKENEPP